MVKRRRDLTVMQQLARGPIDIPFLMLVVILTAIGVIAVFSASYPTAMQEGLDPANYFIKQAGFGVVGLIAMFLISKIKDLPWPVHFRAGHLHYPAGAGHSLRLRQEHCGCPAVDQSAHHRRFPAL